MADKQKFLGQGGTDTLIEQIKGKQENLKIPIIDASYIYGDNHLDRASANNGADSTIKALYNSPIAKIDHVGMYVDENDRAYLVTIPTQFVFDIVEKYGDWGNVLEELYNQELNQSGELYDHKDEILAGLNSGLFTSLEIETIFNIPDWKSKLPPIDDLMELSMFVCPTFNDSVLPSFSFFGARCMNKKYEHMGSGYIWMYDGGDECYAVFNEYKFVNNRDWVWRNYPQLITQDDGTSALLICKPYRYNKKPYDIIPLSSSTQQIEEISADEVTAKFNS